PLNKTKGCLIANFATVPMSITPRFTAGFSVMRLKWKNGCAGTGVTLPNGFKSQRGVDYPFQFAMIAFNHVVPVL
ncbi:hypothetical protein CGK20_25915, partial [Vibrio parahaemolyticus]